MLKMKFALFAARFIAYLYIALSFTARGTAEESAIPFGLSSSELRDINQGLQRLGYFVESDDAGFDLSTAFGSERVLSRLGRKDFTDDFTAHQFAAFLREIDVPKGFPCLEIEAADAPGPMQSITIEFSGDRPDDYLSDFYLRMALCYPAFLNPVAAERWATLDAIGGKSAALDFLPERRTFKTRETMGRVSFILGRYVTETTGVETTTAVPSLEVATVSRKLLKTLTKAPPLTRGESNQSAPVPTKNDIDRICAEMALTSECLGPSLVTPFNAFYADKPVAYEASVPHFVLQLSISLPEKHLDSITTDAIDFVRGSNAVMQGRKGQYLPFIRNYPKARGLAAGLNDEKTKVQNCEISETQRGGKKFSCTDEDAINDYDGRASTLKKDIGWIKPETTSIPKASIIIPDPGFGDLLSNGAIKDVIDAYIQSHSTCVAANSQTHCNSGDDCRRPWCGLRPLYEMTVDIDGEAIFNYDQADEKSQYDYGHGLHVGNIIMGQSPITNSHGLGHSNAQQRSYFSSSEDQADILYNEYNDHNYSPTTREIINYSYLFGSDSSKEFCVPTNDSSPSSLLMEVEKRAQKSTGDPRKINVIASPTVCKITSMREKGLPPSGSSYNCYSTQYRTLACAVLYTNSIGVVALAKDEDGKWDLLNDAKYDLLTDDILWLGAPGQRILSADISDISQTLTDCATIDCTGDGAILRSGYRERSGSSMAAPIVTSLVHRVVEKFVEKQRLSTRDVKKWLFANADIFDVTYSKKNKRVSGVNFYRTLLGKPNKVNVWYAPKVAEESDDWDEACDGSENGRCGGYKLFTFDYIIYDAQLDDLINRIDDSDPLIKKRQLLSVFFVNETAQYLVAIKYRGGYCATHDYPKSCTKYVIGQFPDSKGCAWEYNGASQPCLKGVTESGAASIEDDIYLNSFKAGKISHIVGIDPQHWQRKN
jgi:subtilase family protein